jgi:hypothetical protein
MVSKKVILVLGFKYIKMRVSLSISWIQNIGSYFCCSSFSGPVVSHQILDVFKVSIIVIISIWILTWIFPKIIWYRRVTHADETRRFNIEFRRVSIKSPIRT